MAAARLTAMRCLTSSAGFTAGSLDGSNGEASTGRVAKVGQVGSAVQEVSTSGTASVIDSGLLRGLSMLSLALPSYLSRLACGAFPVSGSCDQG